MVSYDHGVELTLKVNANRDSPKVDTVENVWSAANWLEREVYDLLGVDFVGHSDLRAHFVARRFGSATHLEKIT